MSREAADDQAGSTAPAASGGSHDRLELQSDRLLLRAPRPTDEPALRRVFECPEVVRWWGEQDDDDIEDYLDRQDPEVTVLLLEHEAMVVGLIQFHEEDDPQYRHAGIDLAIHSDHHRRGLGPEAIELVVEHLASIGHHRIVIDPNAANENAIKAYQRVGFKPVGVMRDYEWSEAEETWTDGLLMELLIRERNR